MPYRLIRRMRGMDTKQTTADGILYNDWNAVSELQDECTRRLTAAIQLEEEAYMLNHPEILAMMKMFVDLQVQHKRRKDVLELAGYYFTRPVEEIDRNIRTFLNLKPDEPYVPILAMMKMFVDLQVQHKRRKDVLELAGYYFTRPVEEIDRNIRTFLNLKPDEPYVPTKAPVYSNDLEADLKEILLKHNPMKLDLRPSPGPGTPLTASSSFLSELSSATTLPTPEPVPIPEPTTAEILLKMIENALDKATFSKVTDNMIRYDTAYVELMKAVERAMEIPVIEIRLDIAELIENSFALFNSIIDEKERIAAEIAWEKRMRKKLKRTLRRQKNFKVKCLRHTRDRPKKVRQHLERLNKGYETPPSPKSGEPSSHPSYKIPPLRPCKCHPQWTYNRYPKDRFGIYMPNNNEYQTTNITVSPEGSFIDAPEEK